MSSIISAVQPSVAPQSGVKRALSGNPTGVPGALPAFRGVSVPPGGKVKTPKLSQGNKPNQQSNVPIVYNRVCNLEHITAFNGRLSPGDVAFIHKYPPGFMRSMPHAPTNDAINTFHAANGTATVSRVVGIDGLNRLLHGEYNETGWTLDDNVLACGPDPTFENYHTPYAWPNRDAGEEADAFLTRTEAFGPKCAADVVVPGMTDKEAMVAIIEHNTDVVRGDAEAEGANVEEAVAGFEAGSADFLKQHDKLQKCFAGKRFRLRVLDEHSLDGIIQSNDEMYSFTQSGKRDGTIFNMVIQGPAMTNNGYNCYDGGYLEEGGTTRHANPDNQFLKAVPEDPGDFDEAEPAAPGEQIADEVLRSEYEEGQEAEYQAAVAARDGQVAAWDAYNSQHADYELRRAQHARKLQKYNAYVSDGSVRRPSKNPHRSRLVEKHPRGSIEAANHLFASGAAIAEATGVNTVNGPKVGARWLPTGMYDFVASFTGQYSAYPAQMFDRSPQCMNVCYVGLVAYEMTVQQKLKVRTSTGNYVFSSENPETNEVAARNVKMYYFQYVPFSSRQAWVRQKMEEVKSAAEKKQLDAFFKPREDDEGRRLSVPERLRAVAAMNEEEQRNLAEAVQAAEKNAVREQNAHFANIAARGAKKHKLDEDPFDAIRSHDLEFMVGAWKVGRIMDVKSMRYQSYAGGPANTGCALTLDVQIGWHDVRPQHALGLSAVQTENVQYSYRNRFGGQEMLTYNRTSGPKLPNTDDPTPQTMSGEEARSYLRHVTKIANACRPSLRQLFGPGELSTTTFLESNAFDNAGLKVVVMSNAEFDTNYVIDNQLTNDNRTDAESQASNAARLNEGRQRALDFMGKSFDRAADLHILVGRRACEPYNARADPRLRNGLELRPIRYHQVDTSSKAPGASADVSNAPVINAAATPPAPTAAPAPMATPAPTAAPAADVAMTDIAEATADPTPVLIPSTTEVASTSEPTDAQALSAPMVAATMSAAKASKSRKKSPARTRSRAATAAAATAAAEPAEFAEPATTGDAAGDASNTDDVVMRASAAAPAPRPRARQSSSVVSSVFESVFGTPEESAGFSQAVPQSPTPSSGSESNGGASKPQTFTRRPR